MTKNSHMFLCVVLGLVALAGVARVGQGISESFHRGRGADIRRMWTVGRYVAKGTDPYELGVRILRETYGSISGDDRIRLKDTKIYYFAGQTKWSADTPGIIPELGPPEATYPPSTMAVGALLSTLVAETAVVPVWAFINVVVLCVLLWCFTTGLPLATRLLALSAGLWWPGTYNLFAAEQQGLLITAAFCLYAARPSPHWFMRALLLAVVVSKPSLGIPLAILPVLRRDWGPLIAAGVLHGVLMLGVAAWVGSSPVDLIRNWGEIGRYVTQGTFGLQEVLNRLEWENTLKGAGLQVLFLAAIYLACEFGHRSGLKRKVEALAWAALLWMYHDVYDFVVLVPLICLWLRDRDAGRLVLVAVLGLGLSELGWGGDSVWSRGLRWAGRGAAAALLGVSLFALLRGRAEPEPAVQVADSNAM